MKILAIILVCLIGVGGLVGVAFYYGRTTDPVVDPLESNRIELDKARIEQKTEAIRLKQEQERQQTALLKAKLDKQKATVARQERLESSAGVSWASIALAMFVRILPIVLTGATLTGGGLYLYFKPVIFEFEGIRSPLPRHAVPDVTKQALVTQERKAMVEALAYAEGVTQERVTQIIETVKALKPGRETINYHGGQPALPEAAPQPLQAGNMPTFAEIFDSREIHGDLILGFDEDTPRLGKYEAVHSCLIYGLARSGKTSWLRGLIGQTILTEPETRCDVLDPHAARADSLLGSLPKTKHFHAIDAGDPLPALNAFGDELRRRLLSNEQTFPPRILLIDELPALSRKPYAKQLQALCETTSQEGRKVNCFLLATAQDLRQKKIGDFRESLSSAYFFKGKPNQVGLFLDDPDAEKLYRKNVNRHGVALFSAADEQPRLMSIPECRPNDLKRLELAEHMQADALPVTPQTTNDENVIDDKDISSEAGETTTAQKTGVVIPFRRMKREETPMERQETGETAETMDDDEMRRKIKEMIDSEQETLSGIAAKIGMNKGGVYRFLKENQIPSPTLRAALASFLGVSTMKQEA